MTVKHRNKVKAIVYIKLIKICQAHLWIKSIKTVKLIFEFSNVWLVQCGSRESIPYIDSGGGKCSHIVVGIATGSYTYIARGSYTYINNRTHNEAFAFSLMQTNLQFHLLYFTLLLFRLIIYNLLFQVFDISVLFACVQVKCSIAIQYAVTDGIQWIINQLQLPEAARIFTFTRIGIFKDYLLGKKLKRKRYLCDDIGRSLNFQIILDQECNLQAKLQNPCSS